MKLGLLARADNSGLGVQTHEFYKHMNPDKTLVVDISNLNGNRPYLERYPGAQVVHGIPQLEDFRTFLEGLDVIFIAESPYDYRLYDLAREMGVKTAVQYNYEFFDWFVNPHYPKPDMLIAPSKWHYDRVQHFCDEHNIEHIYLHCPVNRALLPKRHIFRAKTFLHTAGKAASYDRNGTMTVIEASRFLHSPAQILIHFQGEQGLPHQTTHTIADYQQHILDVGNANRVTIEQKDYDNYEDVYKQGDVFILPRRYGGNCLPLNEALSVGMPAIMPDISPNNEFLPDQWLIPAMIINQFTPRTTIDIFEADPMSLAEKIDQMYYMDDEEFSHDTTIANALAESISWHTMENKYKEALQNLCAK
jgi:glycosyltransferase involved in cell wall biosynthesis